MARRPAGRTVRSPVVVLSARDYALGERIGEQRYDAIRRRRAKGRDGDDPKHWPSPFGALCEVAAVRYLDIEGWRPAPYGAPDIPPDIEVRGTRRSSMRVQTDDDPRYRFLLVAARLGDTETTVNRFEMVGWLPGLHAMSREFWTESRQWDRHLGGGVHGIWLVPAQCPPLFPPDTLDPSITNPHV